MDVRLKKFELEQEKKIVFSGTRESVCILRVKFDGLLLHVTPRDSPSFSPSFSPRFFRIHKQTRFFS